MHTPPIVDTATDNRPGRAALQEFPENFDTMLQDQVLLAKRFPITGHRNRQLFPEVKEVIKYLAVLVHHNVHILHCRKKELDLNSFLGI